VQNEMRDNAGLLFTSRPCGSRDANQPPHNLNAREAQMSLSSSCVAAA
jgi:hypothetical protein